MSPPECVKPECNYCIPGHTREEKARDPWVEQEEWFYLCREPPFLHQHFESWILERTVTRLVSHTLTCLGVWLTGGSIINGVKKIKSQLTAPPTHTFGSPEPLNLYRVRYDSHLKAHQHLSGSLISYSCVKEILLSQWERSTPQTQDHSVGTRPRTPWGIWSTPSMSPRREKTPISGTKVRLRNSQESLGSGSQVPHGTKPRLEMPF